MEYNAIGLTKKISRGGSTLAEYSYLAEGARLSAVGSDGSQVPGLFDILQGIRRDPLAGLRPYPGRQDSEDRGVRDFRVLPGAALPEGPPRQRHNRR